MHTEPMPPLHGQRSPWAALLRSKWACLALLAGSLATASSASRADEFYTVLGAGVGAAAGAVIGHSMGGHNGALIGAGAGGLVGAGLAQRTTYPVYPAYPPRAVYVAPPTVLIPAPMPAAPHWRPAPHRHHPHHHHHHGWNGDSREYRAYAPVARPELPFIDGRGDQERLRREQRDWRH